MGISHFQAPIHQTHCICLQTPVQLHRQPPTVLVKHSKFPAYFGPEIALSNLFQGLCGQSPRTARRQPHFSLDAPWIRRRDHAARGSFSKCPLRLLCFQVCWGQRAHLLPQATNDFPGRVGEFCNKPLVEHTPCVLPSVLAPLMLAQLPIWIIDRSRDHTSLPSTVEGGFGGRRRRSAGSPGDTSMHTVAG